MELPVSSDSHHHPSINGHADSQVVENHRCRWCVDRFAAPDVEGTRQRDRQARWIPNHQSTVADHDLLQPIGISNSSDRYRFIERFIVNSVGADCEKRGIAELQGNIRDVSDALTVRAGCRTVVTALDRYVPDFDECVRERNLIGDAFAYDNRHFRGQNGHGFVHVKACRVMKDAHRGLSSHDAARG